tara:strand:+ start:64 stop:1065 length:1002 start_codon:yes stop_codon:yes gene_type:complete
MHVFITGVAGFLGSNLADYYLKKGYKVSGNDTLIGGSLENISKEVNFFECDCENLEKMEQITKNVDVICHAAAYAHEGLSSFSPHLITKNILSGSVSVFTAAIKNKVKRIVHCSSMARYGNIKAPFKEEDSPNPVDPYGVAKLASERILKILCETHGVEYNIAVPHNIIGPKQKYDDPFRNVVSIMINLILQNRRPIIYGDGEQKRSFSDIDDCIFCLDKLMFEKNIKSEIVNIGPEGNYVTINELFKIISNKLKYNEEPIYVPDRPNEVKYAHCSSMKAKKILNFKDELDIETSVERVIEFIKDKGPKKFEYNYDIEIKSEKTPETWLNKIF